jgi:NAD-dependent SIR2 family protein deacetylase
MTPIVNANITRYHYVLGILGNKRNELSTMRHRMDNLRKEISFLSEWSSVLGDGMCQSCNGFGKIRHFLAQDEVEMRRCAKCGGTGLKPTDGAE